VTTVANDDFEFHHSRPFYQRTPIPIEFNQSTYVVPKSQNLTITKSKIFDSAPRGNSSKQLVQRISQEPKRSQQQQQFTNNYDTVVSLHDQREINPAPTSLSMNDLDLIDEMEFKYTPTSVSASIKPKQISTGLQVQEYKQKRMYRKRARVPSSSNAIKDGSSNSRRTARTIDVSRTTTPQRRVLSMECLYPQTQQTDNKNYFDISYLDTGDILVRKADSSKCIFVTDFI